MWYWLHTFKSVKPGAGSSAEYYIQSLQTTELFQGLLVSAGLYRSLLAFNLVLTGFWPGFYRYSLSSWFLQAFTGFQPDHYWYLLVSDLFSACLTCHYLFVTWSLLFFPSLWPGQCWFSLVTASLCWSRSRLRSFFSSAFFVAQFVFTSSFCLLL